MLSHMRAVHWLYWNSHTWSLSDVIVYPNRFPNVILHFSVLRDFWKLILKLNSMVSKKKNALFVWMWDIKIHPSGSPFVSTLISSWCITAILVMVFLSHSHTHYRFLYSLTVVCLYGVYQLRWRVRCRPGWGRWADYHSIQLLLMED